jgi:hypothetical protein
MNLDEAMDRFMTDIFAEADGENGQQCAFLQESA